MNCDLRSTRLHSREDRGGFTLVELLTVISILTVIAAVALGVYAGLTRGADETKTLRNAQTVAAIYASARAAGATFSSAPGDLPGIIDELTVGRHGAGNLATSVFQLSPLAGTEKSAAMEHLLLDAQSDTLIVKTAGP